MPDFLPRREADLLHWPAGFSTKMNDSPESYGLTAQEAGGFAAAQQAYAHWYTLANQPATRTLRSVRIKNWARDTMVTEARALARQIRARPAVTIEQMIALGLRVRASARRRASRPDGAPMVEIGWGRGHRQIVRLTERVTGRCRKPAGVAAAVLMMAVGERSPSPVSKSDDALRPSVKDVERAATVSEQAGPQPRQTAPSRSRLVKAEDGTSVPRDRGVSASDDGRVVWRYWQTAGRLRVPLEPVIGLAPGTKVWVTACWVNARGERGPWSEPVSAYTRVALPSPTGDVRRAG